MQTRYVAYLDRPLWGFMDCLTESQVQQLLSAGTYTEERGEINTVYTLHNQVTVTRIVRPNT